MNDFIKGSLLAGVVALTMPSFAQKNEEKNKEEVQQIIITRSGDKEKRTVIEITGDKITVNGKDAKDADVTVHLNNIRDFNALKHGLDGNWNFHFNDEDQALSLFSEDANRAMLGVVTEEDDKGARITSITKESAAEKAGLKKNDVITRIDDLKVGNTGDVSKAVRKHKPGEKTSITFLRDGKEQTITAELGKWKGIKMNAENFRINVPNPPPMPRVMGYGPGPKLGLSVQDTEDGKGVKVTDVDEEGNAGKAGIKEDDVILKIDDQDINSTDEIAKIVRAATLATGANGEKKAALRFQVLRNKKTQNIEVKIPRKIKTANL
jgi:serine protease Do